MRDILSQGLIAMGLEGKVPGNAVDQLARFGSLLLEKNQVMNLTAIREEARVARLHMLDSAALLQYAQLDRKSLLDVGSGGGFPGLPLKILCPSLELTLLDSQRKRVEWLREVSGLLGLSGVRAVQARAEEQGREPHWRDSFDFVTARAVAELRLLCELCLPFVKPGGAFLAMKSCDSDQELREASTAIKKLGAELEAVQDYPIPGTDLRHRLVRLRKMSPTPKAYPRRWAKIQASPL